MSTHHKDDCPCGSGKRYKHCHLESDQAGARRRWGAAIAVVAALVVGAGAWGAISQWQAGRSRDGAGRSGAADSVSGAPVGGAGAAGAAGDVAGASSPAAPQGAFGGLVPGRNNQAPLPATTARPLQTGSSQALMPGEHPVAWQYDVGKNRHYDPRPGHQHWHGGPPPSDTTGAAPAGGSTPVVNVGGSGTVTVGGGGGTPIVPRVTTTPVSPAGSQALAPGENPAAWEYDAAKNRHFDPRDGHRHWHSGPPPPPAQRGN